VQYSTGIKNIPDIIHGKMDATSFLYESAKYEPIGKQAARVEVARLDVMPIYPFAFSTKWWSKLSPHSRFILSLDE